jgi:hypothetical protein
MFYFRLAGHLKMTVGQLLVSMSSRELSEWMAYYRLEPFGDKNTELCFANALAIYAAGKSGKSQSLNDYMIPKPKKIVQQSPEEMKQILTLWSKRQNVHNKN